MDARTTELMLAAKKGNVQAVSFLVCRDHGQLDEHGDTALIIAARAGNYEAVARLAEYEAGVCAPGRQTALMHLASLGCNPELIKLLTKHEAGMVDARGWTALMCAAFWGHPDLLPVLAPLEAGLQDCDGMTALMHAVVKKRVDVVRYLVTHHSDREAGRKNLLEKTALMMAAATGGEQGLSMVEVLHKLEAKSKDGEGCTALMYAVIYNKDNASEAAKVLVPYERRMQDKNGLTALMHASIRNNGPALSLLAKHEIGMLDSKGYSALTYCIKDYRVLLYQYLTPELDLISRQSPYRHLFKRETLLIDLVFLSAHHTIARLIKQWLCAIVRGISARLDTHQRDRDSLAPSLHLCLELLMEYYLDSFPSTIGEMLQQYDALLDTILEASMCHTCCICLDNPASLIYFPCRHMVVCAQCYEQGEALKIRCVVCKADVSSTIFIKLCGN